MRAASSRRVVYRSRFVGLALVMPEIVSNVATRNPAVVEKKRERTTWYLSNGEPDCCTRT